MYKHVWVTKESDATCSACNELNSSSMTPLGIDVWFADDAGTVHSVDSDFVVARACVEFDVQFGPKINKSGRSLSLLLPSVRRIELLLGHNPGGIIATMLERRSQERFLDAELVMLAWNEDGTKLMQLGNVEDLSLNGMGVILSNALPVGTVVTITYGDRDFTGIVRHQSRREEAHLIGIEFDLPSRNTTVHFHPELLMRCS